MKSNRWLIAIAMCVLFATMFVACAAPTPLPPVVQTVVVQQTVAVPVPQTVVVQQTVLAPTAVPKPTDVPKPPVTEIVMADGQSGANFQEYIQKTVIPAVKAATGWDFSEQEAETVGRRLLNLMRVYNFRNGHTRALEAPSD